MAEETNNKPEAAKPSAAQAEKKAKPSKPEDKPFGEFIEQHFVPELKEALKAEGIEDLNLTFTKQNIPIKGIAENEPCAQVIGTWLNGQRQFNIYFPDEDISGQKAFSYATGGKQPSTIESFMIDERRVTLDLLVLYTLQRLNGQKWLTRN
jgi:hypothetical protein